MTLPSRQHQSLNEVWERLAQFAGYRDVPPLSALIQGEADSVSVTSYGSSKPSGKVCDGTDDTPAIKAAVAAAQVSGCPVFFPAGTYVIDLSSVADGQGAVPVPSNASFFGEAGVTIIKVIGLTGNTVTDGTKSAFRLLGPVSNIVFDGLTFVGQNGGQYGSGPFVHVSQHQSACIEMYETTVEDVADVWVRNCTFRNLWGFSVHSQGNALRNHVTHCTFFQCANGINLNSNKSIQAYNVLTESEGFEAAGEDINISNNVFTNCLFSAISCGGETAWGLVRRGCVIKGNVINGVTEGGGRGIVLNDACVGAVVEGNTIRGTEGYAILVALNDSVHNFNYGHVIKGNVISDCCKDGSGEVSAMLLGGGQGKCLVYDNHISDNNVTNFTTQIGITVGTNQNQIFGNFIASTNYGLAFLNGTSQNVRLWNQISAQYRAYYQGSDAQDPVIENGKTAADYLYMSQVGLNLYPSYAARADGQLEWGPGNAWPPDTNLYRAAANSLKTDDTFAAVGLEATGSDSAGGVILKSANGTRYRVTVSNAGALVITAI